MPLNTNRVREFLKDFDFKTLFIEELGWDHYASQSLRVQVDQQEFTLSPLAEKRGMAVFLCNPDSKGKIPDNALRRKIERQAAKSVHEHIIIYVDAHRSTQVWQWVKKEIGKPLASREHFFHKSQTGEALVQKLGYLMIAMAEEEDLTITDVTGRARKAFDVDKVTKRFYDRFKEEHKVFRKFIQGIEEQEHMDWYASVMLNLLMFIYFIQKKGFLDADTDYLSNKLKAHKAKDLFYRDFLLPLFFDGFAREEKDRSQDALKLLGQIPYLNGGIFLPHPLEQTYGNKIKIPDAAFERLFQYFGQYHWHLDERPLRKDNEINPDVLGYIFEKYINQKQMGAYYTKEDITEYIGKSAIIPFLFDEAKKKCRIAFEGEGSVWRLLKDDPDRYIYPAVRKGADLPLPENIAKGLKDVSKRTDWNAHAPEEYALPTEIWREAVARRQRYEEVSGKLAEGEIQSINDLITYNLDIRQFAQDVIENCEGPELLRAFWHAMVGKVPEKSNEHFEHGVTILDPTCGSGAFLFAALNILEPLYDACLDRMQAFLEELEHSGQRHRPEKFSDFRKVLKRIDAHPNHRYFVLKSIIINNLYGVDIMEEAVEICKLRLFLKLMAQVENVKDIEPLPDIDFNIRAGNTLVGYATSEEVDRAVTFGQFDFANNRARIEEKAQEANRAFQLFHEMQTDQGMEAWDFRKAKELLKEKLRELEDELNRCLARDYNVNPDKKSACEKWLKSHQPFHWFIEFYGIIKKGGFDAIIGNPPYLEKSKLGDMYSMQGCKTRGCRDIYSWVVERAFCLRHSTGRLGLIIPVSLVSSGSFDILRDVVNENSAMLWLSNFANRPGQLFVGAQNRLTIILSSSTIAVGGSFSTRYHRWDARNGERDALFTTMRYATLGNLTRGFKSLYPKVGNPKSTSILRKICSARPLGTFLLKHSKHQIYWVRVPGYFCQFFLDPPKARPEKGGPAQCRGELNSIFAPDDILRRAIHALLNSSTYFQFFCAYTDGRHINPSDVNDFPFDLGNITQTDAKTLFALSVQLEAAMKKNMSVWRKSGLLIESVDSCPTKPIIDEIDRILAKHYGFTDEELDFIINYDIKYRMGITA